MSKIKLELQDEQVRLLIQSLSQIIEPIPFSQESKWAPYADLRYEISNQVEGQERARLKMYFSECGCTRTTKETYTIKAMEDNFLDLRAKCLNHPDVVQICHKVDRVTTTT